MTVRSTAYRSLALLARPYMLLEDGRDRLRVLAYHDVTDRARFELQMHWVAANLTALAWPEAFDRLLAGTLPRRPVVMTFDDGDPTIVEHALPILDGLGLRAVAFVCPGLIDTSDAFWWEVIVEAHQLGAHEMRDGSPVPTVETLKGIDDPTRRKVVTEVRSIIQDRLGRDIERSNLTTGDLERWSAAGHIVGNHTWDHPVLDTCDVTEQRAQIARADEWLQATLPGAADFAYPNGNWSEASQATLDELGYRSAFLFDHRMTARSHPLALSRIRVNANDPLDEFVAKASGLHPALRRIRRRSVSTRSHPVSTPDA